MGFDSCIAQVLRQQGPMLYKNILRKLSLKILYDSIGDQPQYNIANILNSPLNSQAAIELMKSEDPICGLFTWICPMPCQA